MFVPAAPKRQRNTTSTKKPQRNTTQNQPSERSTRWATLRALPGNGKSGEPFRVLRGQDRSKAYLPIGRYGTMTPVSGSTNVRGSPARSLFSGRPLAAGASLPGRKVSFRSPADGGARENQWETSVPAAAINGSAKGPRLSSNSSVRSITCC